jgi:leucyl aminopeptidase (aminopeptidase T)
MELARADRPVDDELVAGARNAVRTCLRLRREERITIITDQETFDIAAALVREVESVGSDYRLWVLEDLAARPITVMPPAILDDLAKSQVSIFAAQAQPGELNSRMAVTELATRLSIRHGHMVNITPQVMIEGMRADFHQVDRLGTWLLGYAEHAELARVTSPNGTDLLVRFSQELRWLKTSGFINAQKWGNLPGGEVFTAPDTVDGRFVVDGVVGDYLCRKYGDLRDCPLIIDIEKSRIVDVVCDNEKLLKEFRRYVSADENSDRVGEFALGTNLAVQDVCGNILQDEKMPGIHLAFGHPYSEHTGQTWVSSTHMDCVGRDFSIWFDRVPVMRDGRYLWQDSHNRRPE